MTDGVAVTQVELVSHAVPGADVSVVAVVASDCPPPVAKVVEVAVTFQPAPEPVASLMSSGWLDLSVWSRPVRVSLNYTAGGGEMNANEPAVSVAVADVAPAGPAAARIAMAPMSPAQAQIARTRPNEEWV